MTATWCSTTRRSSRRGPATSSSGGRGLGWIAHISDELEVPAVMAGPVPAAGSRHDAVEEVVHRRTGLHDRTGGRVLALYVAVAPIALASRRRVRADGQADRVEEVAGRDRIRELQVGHRDGLRGHQDQHG